MVTTLPRAVYKALLLITLFMLLLMIFLGMTPLPAVAQTQHRGLQWTEIEKPGLDGNVVVHPSDVSDIALGSSVFYAIDINQARIYRSMSGGLRWEDISSHLSEAGASLPATKIAIAPDEAAIIAAATDGGTSLYLSVDGGITWGNMQIGAITGSIQSIAISKPYGENNEQRDVLVGTALFGDGLTSGQVWLLHLGSFVPYWRNLNIWVDPTVIGGEVSAVAFSPKYTDDQTILAIASTDSDVAASYRNRTFLCIGLVDLAISNTVWNSISGYPLEIFDSTFYLNPPYLHSSGDGPGVTLISGGLVLPGSFTATGTSSGSRMLYAFYTVQPTPANDTSNAYRINDMTSNKATAFIGAGTRRYSSLALSGKTLLAGEVTPYDSLTVAVQISLDATALSPVFSLTGYPYGPGNAKVAWNSNVAYSGTGKDPLAPPGPPDESGFSISTDSGLNWVQVGLIDTTVSLQDVAVASSPQSIFITATSSSNIESVWRSAGEPLGEYWGRVLAIDVPSNKIIARISPHYQDDYTLYVCEVGLGPGPPVCNQLWVTNDRGNAWKEYTAPLGVIDLAVVDKEVLYVALPGGNVSRSYNSGRSWPDTASTVLTDIAMLSFIEPDTTFVGGNNGDVAYSSDNGTNYTRIPETIIGGGSIQVVADTGYQDNNLIYASSGNTIYRWVIGQSQHWDAIRAADVGSQITGMATVDGILYGAWYTVATGSGTERSLGPTLRLEKLEWDSLRSGASAAKFDSMPTSLRYTTTETCVILWTIDSISFNLMVYFDCLALKGPELTMDNNATIGCDPVTGRNQEVNFTWNDICDDNRYQLQIAKDTNFTLVVYDSGDNYPFLLPAMGTSPAVYFPAGGEANSYGTSAIAELGNLECGHTYNWRVRARSATTGDIIRSPWSEVRSFLIKIDLPVSADCYGPELLTPDNGCLGCSVNPASFSWSPFKETSEYKFVLAKDAAITQIVAEAEVPTTAFEYYGHLAYSSNYFWRVMATAPFVSDWSATFSFQTEPAPTKPSTTSTEVSASTPIWVWMLIGLGSVSVVVVMLLLLLAGRNR